MKLAALALSIAACVAQAQTGKLEGVVRNAAGVVAGVEVRVRNNATEAVQLATTGADGTYSFTLPAGTYDAFAFKIAHSAYTKRDIAIAAAATVHLDINMVAISNEGVPGEFSFLELRARTGEVTGPVPHTADGKPDLSGLWLPSPPLESDDPIMKPWAAALAKERAATGGAGDPRAHCLPSGVVRTNNADYAKFVHVPNLLVMLIEGAPPGFRQIFIGDNQKHPDDLEPSWMGHSIGKWDGDTLIVDTIGFHDRGWVDGAGRPQTEKTHIVERFRRVSKGILEVRLTVEDPTVYEKSWGFRRELKLSEGDELREYVCNENEKTEHFAAH
ncbi:MAG: carboxypeptidase-like regulatory domain-containing protein [Acidobacteriota bacterium]